MIRSLLYTAATLLALAPAGVAVGLWLAVGAGAGIATGSGLYGLTAWWVLTADLLPNPAPISEAVR